MRLFTLYIILFNGSFGLFGQSDSTQLQKPTDSLQTFVTLPLLIEIVLTHSQIIDLRSTVSGASMGEQEIKERIPEDLGDITRTFPGVYMRSYGGLGGLKTMNARGLGSQHFLLISNGAAQLFNQQGSANLGDFQADGIINVKYTIGGVDVWHAPVLSKTHVGVLQINNKDYQFTPHRKTGQINLSLGSFGRYKLGANTFLSKEKWSIFIQAYGYNYQGDYPYKYQYGLVSLDTIRTYNLSREAGARAGAMWMPNTKHRFNFSAQGVASERELPGAVVFYQPVQFQNLSNRFLQTTARHSWTFMEHLDFVSFANFSYLNTNYSDDFQLNMPFSQNYIEQNLDIGHNGLISLKRIKLNYGLQHIISTLRSNRANILYPIRHRTLAQFGATWNIQKIKFRVDMPMQYLIDETRISGEKKDNLLFTPSFGLNWSKTRNKSLTAIRFSAGQFARVATFSELFFGQSANFQLNPELSKMINVGIHRGDFVNRFKFNYGLDAFYGRINDKIVSIPTQNLFVWSFINVQEVESYGFDVIFVSEYFHVSNNFRLELVLKTGLNVAQDVSDALSSTYGQQIPYTPFWNSSTQITSKFKSWTFSYEYSFTDFRYVLGENIAANVLDEFHLSDLRVSYEGKFSENNTQGYRVHAKCNNLLNTQYQVMRGFPMPGRNFEIGFTWLW